MNPLFNSFQKERNKYCYLSLVFGVRGYKVKLNRNQVKDLLSLIHKQNNLVSPNFPFLFLALSVVNVCDGAQMQLSYDSTTAPSIAYCLSTDFHQPTTVGHCVRSMNNCSPSTHRVHYPSLLDVRWWHYRLFPVVHCHHDCSFIRGNKSLERSVPKARRRHEKATPQRSSGCKCKCVRLNYN